MKREQLIALSGCALQLIALVMMASVVPRNAIKIVGIYFLLFLLGYLIRGFLRKKYRISILHILSVLTMALSYFSRAILQRPEDLPGTAQATPYLLVFHLLFFLISSQLKWSARKVWAGTVALTLSGIFMDGWFHFAPSALVLPAIILPGLNYRLILGRLSEKKVLIGSFLSFIALSLLGSVYSDSYFSLLRTGALFLLPAFLWLGLPRKFLISAIGIALLINLIIYSALALLRPETLFKTVVYEINPNRVAAYLAYGVVFVAATLREYDWPVKGSLDRFRKLLRPALPLLVLSSGCMIVLLLSSEGALLALVYGSLVLLMSRMNPISRRPFLLIGAACMPLIVSIITIFSLMILQNQPTLVTMDSVSHARLPLWGNYLELIFNRGIIGQTVGGGPFVMDHLAVFLAESNHETSNEVIGLLRGTDGLYVHSHNVVIEFVNSFGWLGLLAFFSMMLSAILPDRHRAGHGAAMALLGGIMLHGLVEFLLDIPAISFLFWGGLLSTGYSFKNWKHSSIRESTLMWTSGIFALLCTIVSVEHFRLEKEVRNIARSYLGIGVPIVECQGVAFFKIAPPNLGTAGEYENPWRLLPESFMDPAWLRKNASLALFRWQTVPNIERYQSEAREAFLQCIRNSHSNAACLLGYQRSAQLRSIGQGSISDPFGLINECQENVSNDGDTTKDN
ncbi:MAG: hypothetical protein RH862_14945 [Leptospiraceae bacterium]